MLATRVVSRASRPRASSSSALLSCNASGNQLPQGHRLFSITALRQANGNTYYVATLPWADKDQNRKERFNDLIKNSRFTDNDSIVASSITTSKRASPIASSLKSEIDRIKTTAEKKGGGAWLLLKATNEDEAKTILKDTNAGEVFDLDNMTLQVVELDQSVSADGGEGPLYDGNSSSTSTSTSTSTSANAVSSDVDSNSADTQRDDLTSGNVYMTESNESNTQSKASTSGKNRSTEKKPKKDKKDKTNRKASENAADAEESRTGGHSVETSGPLYGK